MFPHIHLNTKWSWCNVLLQWRSSRERGFAVNSFTMHHTTAGLGISDQTVSAHSEMQFGFPLGLETAGRTLPQRRKEAMEECCHQSSGFFFQGRNGTKGNYQQLSA